MPDQEDTTPNETERANARLISAAPDLLAALEAVAKWWGAQSPQVPLAVIRSVNTALTKAKATA